MTVPVQCGAGVLRYTANTRATKRSSPCLHEPSLTSRTDDERVGAVQRDQTVDAARNAACNELDDDRQL